MKLYTCCRRACITLARNIMKAKTQPLDISRRNSLEKCKSGQIVWEWNSKVELELDKLPCPHFRLVLVSTLSLRQCSSAFHFCLGLPYLTFNRPNLGRAIHEASEGTIYLPLCRSDMNWTMPFNASGPTNASRSEACLAA